MWMLVCSVSLCFQPRPSSAYEWWYLETKIGSNHDGWQILLGTRFLRLPKSSSQQEQCLQNYPKISSLVEWINSYRKYTVFTFYWWFQFCVCNLSIVLDGPLMMVPCTFSWRMCDAVLFVFLSCMMSLPDPYLLVAQLTACPQRGDLFVHTPGSLFLQDERCTVLCEVGEFLWY